MKLKTSDVPQADSLALVRRVLEATPVSPSTAVKDLAGKTKFSERHVRYRLQAARILGFLKPEGEPELTPRAKRLLATEVSSPEEKKQLVSAIRECASVQLIAPNLLALPEVDVKKVGDRIARLSGLSTSTAPHEATAASDIYALGISWYEMLTGDTPDPAVVAAKALVDPCSDVETNALIRRMLEFDQSKRPTASDILSALSSK